MKKIFSIIFWLVIIFIITYSSFLVKNWKNYEKPNFSELSLESIFFDINDENKIEKNKWKNTKVEFLNYSDKILSLSWNYNFSEKSWEINLEKWYFLININSIDKNYLVKHNWFKIEIDSPSSIFIDTISEKIKIFSIDNILKLSFLWNQNWKEEIFNTIFLYPNQYVFFDPKKNFFLNWWDLLKVNQILSLWYFNWNIFKNEEINEDFKNNFLSKDDEIRKNQENLFKYIIIDYNNRKKDFEEFKKKNIVEISWESSIEKYYFLFFNKEKKSIYLKNNILKDIKEILNNENIKDSDLNIYLNKIWEKLEELENLKREWDLKEIKNIIKKIIWTLNLIEKDNKKIIELFSKIVDKNFDNSSIKENHSLNHIFFKYNFISWEDFYSNIKNFIEIKSNLDISEKEKNYFIFFLNKIILTNLNEEDINFEDTISIFKNFSKSAINYYSAKNLETNDWNSKTIKQKIIETWINDFNFILTNLINKLETHFFTKNSNWILEPKKWKEINKDSIEILEKSIDNIYEKFLNINIDSINDNHTKNNYIRNLERFKKLDMALTDYQNYLVNNDSKISDLTSVLENENNDLSKSKAISFLKKFNYLNLSERNIEIMWKDFCSNPSNKEYEKIKDFPTCYQISEVNILNDNISFLLHPNDFNKISNIIINGDKNKNKWIYRLDTIEESFSSSSDSWNDFKNFFVNVIIPTNEKIDELPEIKSFENIEKKSESSIIRTLKNTNLLWKNWTLTKLNHILDIKYDDVSVTETDDKKDYIIKINNSAFKYKSDDEYKWFFNSDYKYKKGNFFFNPEIIFSEENSWKKIKISWIISLEEFSEVIDKLFSNMKDLMALTDVILEKDTWEIDIIYFYKTDKLQVSTKNIKVTIIWEKIESITYFWKKILVKNEKMDKIEKLLK